MLDLAARRYSGKRISAFSRILDFGCGAGRILQFFPAGPELYGCDVNQRLVSYVAHEFANVQASCNTPSPPLRFADGQFDLVYSFSVFSHLTEADEQSWLKELLRVGNADCLFLVTVHGDWMIEATLGAKRKRAEAAGFYFRKVHKRTRTNLGFPDGYEASYHTSSYIRERWSECFDIEAIIKGDRSSNYLWDGADVGAGGSLPSFRPMGQDLVVMRRHRSSDAGRRNADTS